MNCPHCQQPLPPGAQTCTHCSQPPRPYGGPQPSQGDSTGGVIPYKNAPALIAYYLGLFSILPLIGIVLGVPAVILGIIGLKKFKQTPQVKGRNHAYVGIGCGGLSSLFWLLFLVTGIILPMLKS